MKKILLLLCISLLTLLPAEFAFAKNKPGADTIEGTYTCHGYCVDKNNEFSPTGKEIDQFVKYPDHRNSTHRFEFYQLMVSTPSNSAFHETENCARLNNKNLSCLTTKRTGDRHPVVFEEIAFKSPRKFQKTVRTPKIHVPKKYNLLCQLMCLKNQGQHTKGKANR